MLLYATASVADAARFEAAVTWLLAAVEQPEGFVSLEVYRSYDDPTRVAFVERWESVEAFERARTTYGVEQRAEFHARAGIDGDTFVRELWSESDIPAVRGAVYPRA